MDTLGLVLVKMIWVQSEVCVQDMSVVFSEVGVISLHKGRYSCTTLPEQLGCDVEHAAAPPCFVPDVVLWDCCWVLI